MTAGGDVDGEDGTRVGWSRRRFLAGSGLAAGGLALGLGACSDDDSAGSSDGAGPSTGDGGSTSTPSAGGTKAGTPDPDTGIVDADVPTEAAIYGWISKVFHQGIRRPGYPANIWAETWIKEQFESIGLEHVRLEPVKAVRWEPTSWTVRITAGETTRELTCFPVPFAAPTSAVDLDLAELTDDPSAVAGRAALVDVPLITIPAAFLATTGSAPDDPTGRVFDPEGTFDGGTHTVPFGTDFQAVMKPAIDAGAKAFLGTLTGYPGNSCNYFVPYDAVDRPIPGIWLSGSDGAWLREQLAAGPVQVHLEVATETTDIGTYNVVGELPGADDETVMVASHHDGPWSSAVEDASGISMVLAQATYWAAQPKARRPHRMVFLVQGGHMSGGAGLITYVNDHRDELDEVVLEVHLEHVARECHEVDGKVVPLDTPTPRWFFTSRNPALEAKVGEAIEGEELWRSLILAPDAFGAQPPTDGALYHLAGVPVVNVLAAPFYLFDRMDTLDKIHRSSLVPLARTTIRIIDGTAGVSAAEMRSGVV